MSYFKTACLVTAALVLLWLGLVVPGTSRQAEAQPTTAPQAVARYQDFSAWYQTTYKLKALPYRAAALIDATTGTPLYFHQESTTMPTASLIKMVTAGTLLHYSPNWYSPLSFTENENEGLLRPYVGPADKFSLLKLEADDHITLEQAFASMLIGSANNAAVSVGKAVGLSRNDFIAAMRATANRWGMTRTTVEEPSGLSLNNTSNAQDLARAACAVYGDFMASFYGSSSSVSFTTAKGVKKTVLHTVHDLRLRPGSYFGAKTGYLTETQYHVAAGLITPQGHRLCAAVLTSPSRAESEQALNALRLWADEMYHW
ncbi:MAG: serine hydrolase [Candidatus Veblenbacteria bacterium]|nr:serine hydrolase [Candidatus Veblenbacteria bacterium]